VFSSFVAGAMRAHACVCASSGRETVPGFFLAAVLKRGVIDTSSLLLLRSVRPRSDDERRHKTRAEEAYVEAWVLVSIELLF
jgi:hypothetical protein